MSFFFQRIAIPMGAGPGLLAFGAMLGVISAQERTVQFPLVPDAHAANAAPWSFTMDDPGAGWADTGFDASAWPTAQGGFGTGTIQGGSPVGYAWPTSDIWMRKTFTVTSLDFSALVLSLHHDDDVGVYINGTLVLNESFTGGFRSETYLTDEAKAALKIGPNVIAVHCRNNDGPGYIDAGLSAAHTAQAYSIVKDSRDGGEDWSWTDVQPGAGWSDTGFADDTWTVGKSGFGSAEFGTKIGTHWGQYEIWLRKKITLAKPFGDYLLTYLHDDEVEIYINGMPVLQESGSGWDYKEIALTGAKAGLVAGENVLAIHCTNSGGGPQATDAGLTGLETNATTGTRLPVAHAARSGSRSPVLFAMRGGALDLSALGSAHGAVLELYGMNGALRASLRPEGGKSLRLPAGVTGTFRYRWRSAAGIRQGILIGMP